jgi:hypothetical protein
MRGDGLPVSVNLPEQKRLDEAPSRDQRVPVVERGAKRKRLQHVAVEVDIPRQIGFSDIALIQAAQRAQGPLVAQADMKGWLALADGAPAAVRQFHREGRRDLADTINESVERRCG